MPASTVTATATGHPRLNTGRDLEHLSRRPDGLRLHVDRPCLVCRQGDGRWGWQCSLCPLPLRLLTTCAGSWRTAIEDASHHLRTSHERGTGRGSAAATDKSPLGLAA